MWCVDRALLHVRLTFTDAPLQEVVAEAIEASNESEATAIPEPESEPEVAEVAAPETTDTADEVTVEDQAPEEGLVVTKTHVEETAAPDEIISEQENQTNVVATVCFTSRSFNLVIECVISAWR